MKNRFNMCICLAMGLIATSGCSPSTNEEVVVPKIRTAEELAVAKKFSEEARGGRGGGSKEAGSKEAGARGAKARGTRSARARGARSARARGAKSGGI